MSAERRFTPEEAQDLLPALTALLERIAEAQRVMDDTHDEVMASVPTNGGGPVHRRFVDAARAADEAMAEVKALGVVLRDPASGLVDLPAERDGEVVYLCWKLGEPRVAWWHPIDTGFAGRQPL